MKISAISGDMAVKLALAGAGLLVLAYGWGKVSDLASSLFKGPKELLNSVGDAAQKVVDGVATAASQVADKERVGGVFLSQYDKQLTGLPGPDPTNWEKTYKGPLVTNDGMDFGPFGGLSG